jgi:hypothetical protein
MSIVAVEVNEKHHRVLLHMENNGSISPTKTNQTERARVEAQTSLHPKPVSRSSLE